MIKVHLREKKIAKGKKTLYLDFYPPIPHPATGKLMRHLTLKLYVFQRPKNSTEKTHNEETRTLAETIRAQRQLEVQAGAYGFLTKATDKDFLAYYEKTIDAQQSKSGETIRRASYKYFSDYSEGSCSFSKLTEKYVEGFRKFLLDSKLFQNTAADYFTHFKIVYNLATRERLVPVMTIPSIQKLDVEREFLSYDELNKLNETPYPPFPEMRRAALFSALTGLRFSDVAALTWEEVRYSSESGHFLRFTQKKTGRPETMPISEEARNQLTKNDSEMCFPYLPYQQVNKYLCAWLALAGITRHITFHAFRHTFGTLQLSFGSDIYTVSKMLGHTTLAHTLKYTHMIDSVKREAADKMKFSGAKKGGEVDTPEPHLND